LEKRAEQVLTRSRGWRWGLTEVGGEVAQTMYTHVSKCKNNKIKGEKNSIVYKYHIFLIYSSIGGILADSIA
jgi:hypothetical protein